LLLLLCRPALDEVDIWWLVPLLAVVEGTLRREKADACGIDAIKSYRAPGAVWHVSLARNALRP